jgi:Glycine cleavage H-protein
MFPWANGSHWGVDHVIFISLFFAVVLTLVSLLLVAVSNTVLNFRSHRAAGVCWREDFAEMPEAERHCRHELAGRVPFRICDNAFDCRHCGQYAQFAVLPSKDTQQSAGVDYSDNLLYHRGHTWVRQEEDGTLAIGLDDFARRVAGHPDCVQLPALGAELECNGIAWRMVKNGHEIQVRAPVDGTVVSTSAAGADACYLKIRPRSPVDLRHLLRAAEIPGWLESEVGRLHSQFRASHAAATMSDGGMVLPDLMDALPRADWDQVLPSIFLEP